MKMKRAKMLGGSLAALLGLLVALTIGASSAGAGSYSAPLNAGQSLLAGHVEVTTSATSVSVLFVLEPGFVLTQAHVDVQSVPDDIPQTKNGNPIPGQFAQHGRTVGPYVFAGLVPATKYVVAAHAVVWNGLTTVNVVSSASTAGAVETNEPFNYANCSFYTESDASKSVWDNGVGTTAYDAFTAAGADWIWDALNPKHPIEGDVVSFTETFDVGLVTGTPTLMITADNGYTVGLNGSFVGNAQLGPGFPTTLKEEVIPGAPQTGDWGVASQGWQTVETYNVNLTSGQNTLAVTAANEYMWNQSGYLGPDWYLAGYNPVGGARTPDPAPGIGMPNDGSQCFNPGYNPAGLIYKLSYSHYTTSNTAWGYGTRFTDSAWGSYFEVETDAA